MALLPKQFESMSLEDNDIISTISVGKKSKKKTVEETYKKISQLEHILLRPDTYIGSSERMTQTTWVWNETANRMVHKEVTFPPGLYKIFDEILVNAADHKQRDASMSMIKVEIEPENNLISVWNNGAGIPIEMHKEENVYVPELIFGHLLTSSNYDDDEKKVVGGRNGYGAKLANIFSTEFIVETANSSCGKKYKQVFSKNMSVKGKPQIRAGNKKEDWTKITFSPDLAKFDMTCLDADIVALLKKRVYDIAGINPSLKVYLNGERLLIKSFKGYVNLYIPDTPVYYERLNERWEVAIAPSEGQLTQISFVNSIWTMKGGTHVNNIADQVAKVIGEHITKKDKKMKVKPFQIKSQLSLYVNCLIENPAFDSQTKETLTTKPGQFGSKWKFTEDFAKKIMKSEIIANVLEYARFKQSKELAKTDGGKKGRIMGIPNLDDANKAGGRDASNCTLILTEGLSAKALVVSAFSVIGRDYYGCFPLRGKLLNVREASHKQIMDNAEINNLKKILGLQHKKKYDEESIKSLRYGHVLIMTDQDHDGSHIKGLLLNFFDHFWPGLLQVKGFLQEFITPIVKVSHGKKREFFYTQPEFKTWCEINPTKAAKWNSKYLKGLGSSEAEDVKTFFADLKRHLLTFRYGGQEDKTNIDMAFSKQRVEDRKQWLSEFVPGTFFKYGEDDLTYSNFVNKELILFSMADNARSIPSVIDGLKPSQRKVLYGVFKKKCVNEIKVGALSSYVGENTMYHHGDASLQATVIGLAQNFVGSNNINLLHPGGQFGTRLQGGKDAASARYISTRLTNSARGLFPVLDDPLLNYLVEESESIEPEWYCPVIPLVLVNGSDGIGTGWSTSVPSFNPRDIINNVRAMLRGEPPTSMIPWYRGFKGKIVPVGNSKSFDVHGTLMKCEEDTMLRIIELPIGSWTSPYKEFLEANAVGHADAAKKPFIKGILDNGTENDVCFTINLTQEGYKSLESVGFYKKLKLTGSVSTSNMVLFDHQGRIRKYEDTNEILAEFFKVRLDLYEKRRIFLLKELREEELRLENRARFIQMVIAGSLTISNRPKKDLMAELKRKKFDEILPKTKKNSSAADPEDPNEESSDDESTASGKGYDYLLSMALWSLTKEKVAKLLGELADKKSEIEEMLGASAHAMWEKDLQNLEGILDENDKKAAKHAAELAVLSREARMRQQKGIKGKGRKGKSVVVFTDADFQNDEEISPPAARSVAIKKPRKPKAEPKMANSKSLRGGKKTAAKKEEDIELAAILDDEDEDEDEILTLDIKPAVKRPTRNVARKTIQNMDLEDEDEFSEDESEDEFKISDMLTPVKKPVLQRNGTHRAKAPAKQKEEDLLVAKKPSRTALRQIIEESDSSEEEIKDEDISVDVLMNADSSIVIDSDDDDMPMSLAERLAQRLAITSPEKKDESAQKKTNGKPPVKKPAKKPSKKAASATAVKRPRSKGNTAAMIGLSPSVARKVKRSRVKTPKTMKMKPATKKDEDEFELQSEDEDPSPVAAPKRRPQRGNVRKAIVIDSSSDEDDADSDFAADDDSDFE